MNNINDLFSKIFLYKQTFARKNILANFLLVLQKASTRHIDDLELEVNTYKIQEKLSNFLESKELHDTDNILKWVDINKYKLEKDFDTYHIAKMYYILPINYYNHLSTKIANIILEMHIILLKNYAKQSCAHHVRFFVKFIEIAMVAEDFVLKSLLCKNFFISVGLKKSILILKNIKISDTYDEKSEITVKEIKDSKIDFSLHIDNDSTLYFNLRTNIKHFSDTFIIRQLQNDSKSFSDFISGLDTNRKPKTKDERKKPYLVVQKKIKQHENFEENIEETNRNKDYIIPRIEINDNLKNTKHRQMLQVIAISSSLAKKKLLLESLYDIPRLPLFSEFIKHVMSKISQKQDQISDFYCFLFVISALLGYNVEQILQIIFSNSFSFQNKSITIPIQHEKFFARNEEYYNTTYNNSINYEITYFLPNKLAQYINHFTQNFTINQFSKKSFKDYMKNTVKQFYKTIHIPVDNIWLIAQQHKKVLTNYEDINIILCTSNYNQNDTSRIAYSSTPKTSFAHSAWILEYIRLLDLNKYFNDSRNNQQLLKIDNKKMVGSRYDIKTNKIQNFFEQLETLMKKERNPINKFNLFTLYIRYACSFLLGLRVFKISVTFHSICFRKNIILVKEKSDNSQSGYRIIPICTTMKKLLIAYFNKVSLLNKNFKIANFQNNTIGFIIKNQKLEFKHINKNEIFYNKAFKAVDMDFIKSANLNVGRHNLMKMAIDKNLNIEYIRAFYGHYPAGGEFLGKFSCLDNFEYKNYMLNILEQLATILNINEIDYAI